MDHTTAMKGIDLILQHSDHVGADGPIGIGFTGGEPMLHWGIIQRIVGDCLDRDWSDRCLAFNMTTNGTLLERRHLRFLQDHKVNLTISLDGPKEIHDEYRVFPEGKGTFERVMQTVELIRSSAADYFDQHVVFSIVASYPVDWITLDRFFREELTVPAGRVMIAGVREGNLTLASDPAYKNHRHIGYDTLKARFLRAACQGALFGDFPSGSVMKQVKNEGNSCLTFQPMIRPMLELERRQIEPDGWPEGPLRPRGCCMAPARRLLISCDGSLYPCDRMDFNDSSKIGHVASGLNLDKVIRMQREFYELTAEECSRCWGVRLCNNCWAKAVGASGFERTEKLSHCDYIRADLHDRLQTYCSIVEERSDAFDDKGEVVIG
jgi:uncharacterized protein